MGFFSIYPPSAGGSSGGVTSLNGQTGALTLVAGSGITITPGSGTLTIASTGSSGANTALSNLTSPTAINQNLIFDNNANYFIQSPDDPGAGETKDLTLKTGDTASGDLTGNLNLTTGNAGAGQSGDVRITTGTATGANSGNILFQPGTSDATPGVSQFNDADGNPLLTISPGHFGLASSINTDSPTRTLGGAGFGFAKVGEIKDLNDNVLLDFTTTPGVIGIPTGVPVIPADNTVNLGSSTNTFGQMWVDIINHPGSSTPSARFNFSSLSDEAGNAAMGWTNQAGDDTTLFPRQLVANDGATIMLDWATPGALSANSNKISNVTDPAAAQDAATKNYVDTNSANTALNNLASTAVNASIIPNVNDAIDLGSSGKKWSNVSVDSNSGFGLRLYQGVTEYAQVRANITTPSGVSSLGGITALSPNGATTYPLALITANNAGVNATATGTVYIESGNKTAGTGNSGDISLQTGTSSGGVRGQILLNADRTTFGGLSQLFNSAADPVVITALAGDMYFNTTLNKAKVFNGTTWETITSA